MTTGDPTDDAVLERIARHADLLGRGADWVIAREIGVTLADIERYRAKYGRANPLRPSTRPKPKAAPPPAPAPPSSDKVARLTAPKQRSIFEDHLDIVGVWPDIEVARKLGVTRAAVHAYRKRHGIPRPAARAPWVPRPPHNLGKSKLDAVHEWVGVLPDAEVATRAGLSPSAVSTYRRRNGIPRAGAQREAPERPSAVYGWKLTIATGAGEVTRYALGDAEGVCRLGQQVGEVLAVERIGEGLA